MNLKLFIFILPIYLVADSNSFDEILAPIPAPEVVIPPFRQIDARADWITQGKIKTEETSRIFLGFKELDTRANYIYPSGCTMWAASLGYQAAWLDFGKSPFHNQKHFHNLYGTIGGRFFKQEWSAQGEIQYNVDVERGVKNGVLYFFGGWGTYSFPNSLSLSVGFLARYGMEQDKLWPVLGFEWLITPEWEIHALFPTNVALVYRPLNDLSLSLTTRFINSRHRFAENEIIPSGIFEYRNTGEELGLTYTIGQFFSLNLHAGWMFQGDLVLERSDGIQLNQLKSEGSFYFGGNFFLRF